jgi:CBS domain-containing protein
MQIKDITKEAVLIHETASFRDAIEMMVSKKTNALLVVDDNGKLTGEVCVSDLLDAIVPEYLDGDSIAAHFATGEMFEEAVKDTEKKEVQFFMSRDISGVTLEDNLMSVAVIAIAHQQARIPVVDSENRPIAIISRQGLKHMIANDLGIKDSE